MFILYCLFWIGIFLIAYSYVIYPALLWFFSKRVKTEEPTDSKEEDFPTMTLFITAYNEEKYINEKVANSQELIYPKDKLKQVWLTDGSTDQTNELLANYPHISVFYNPERKGKTNAINRGMQFVDTELVVFSDANTLLNAEALLNIARKFENKKVGCVAGEKRIFTKAKNNVAAFGEGFYWKYESFLKQLDAKLGSTIGAAGELFGIRTSLFSNIPDDMILDDFLISMRIAMQGYKIDYSPNAFAIENPSANIDEEMKRKIRIAAGSIQATVRLKKLLNPFRYKFLSVQYLSHKVLRWIVIPYLLPMLIIVNLVIICQKKVPNIYLITAFLQATMYILALLGKWLKNKNISWNFIFIPYYFFMANYAMYLGLFRYSKGKQTVIWEQAKRAN